MFTRTVLGAAYLLAAGTWAQAGNDRGPTLSDLAWMEGHWVVQQEEGRVEEIWMGPLDGSMVGSFRWTVPGTMHVLEFLVIAESDEGILFRFKHFGTDYRAWEDTPNTYRLVEASGRRAVFENEDWNGRVPQRVEYSSPRADRLVFLGTSPGDAEPLRLEFVRK